MATSGVTQSSEPSEKDMKITERESAEEDAKSNIKAKPQFSKDP